MTAESRNAVMIVFRVIVMVGAPLEYGREQRTTGAMAAALWGNDLRHRWRPDHCGFRSRCAKCAERTTP
jgi:hypothetical protein